MCTSTSGKHKCSNKTCSKVVLRRLAPPGWAAGVTTVTVLGAMVRLWVTTSVGLTETTLSRLPLGLPLSFQPPDPSLSLSPCMKVRLCEVSRPAVPDLIQCGEVAPCRWACSARPLACGWLADAFVDNLWGCPPLTALGIRPSNL